MRGQPVEESVPREIFGLGKIAEGEPTGKFIADGLRVGRDGKAREPVVVVAEHNPAGSQEPSLAGDELRE